MLVDLQKASIIISLF